MTETTVPYDEIDQDLLDRFKTAANEWAADNGYLVLDSEADDIAHRMAELVASRQSVPTDEELLEAYYAACRSWASFSSMPASLDSLRQGGLQGIRAVRARLLGVTTIPEVSGSPMTPEALADEVQRVVMEAQARVGPGSIGAEQYHVDGQPQKFETMPLDGLAEYMYEEALDLINYGVMMSIRARRLQSAGSSVEAKGVAE